MTRAFQCDIFNGLQPDSDFQSPTNPLYFSAGWFSAIYAKTTSYHGIVLLNYSEDIEPDVLAVMTKDAKIGKGFKLLHIDLINLVLRINRVKNQFKEIKANAKNSEQEGYDKE